MGYFRPGTARDLRASGGGHAIKKSAPGVHPLNRVGWQKLADLIAIVESGSLRAAARRLGVSVNTVRARLAGLEEAAGRPLVVRTVGGIRLTAAGSDLHQRALRMRQGLAERADEADDALAQPGRITIACTEGIDTGWLTPRIADLKRRLPDLTVNLEYDFDLQRDRSRTCDVGLTFAPPLDGDLVVTKLATLHFMLFASPFYLSARGTPRSMDDLLSHLFVEQVTPGYNSSVLDLFLGSDRPRRAATVQTNSVVTQLWAAAGGAGIALLPSYICAITSLLVPLPVLPQLRFPLSGYHHAGARHSPAVRQVMEWLRDAFDARLYPWFAERFVHPDDFPDADRGEGDVARFYELMASRIAGDPPREDS